MTRRALLWWVLAVLALMVLGTAWFLSEFERVPSTRWEEMGRAARMNPYLALERFAGAVGRRVQTVSDVRQLGGLPPGGVLILDRNRRRQLPPDRAEALLRWVANGGYLIVAAEGKGTEDPLLRRLGVAWYQPARKDGEASGPEGENAPEALPGGRVAKARQQAVQVRIPGAEPLLMDPAASGLVAGKLKPLWQSEVEAGQAQLLHYAWGRGQITVLDCFCAFSNVKIGQYDHAAIVWSLLSSYQPRGTVWLALRLGEPGLWEWLLHSAWMPLLSGAVLVLLWLWRIVPRFGGLRSLPEPERRGLADHLAAVGRGVWREGGLAHWVHILRQALLASIARRHPHVLNLPAAERSAALARLSGLSAVRVHQALEGPGTGSLRTFTDTVRAIQQLQQRL